MMRRKKIMAGIVVLMFVKVTIATADVVMLNFLVSRASFLFFHFVSETDSSFLGSSVD